MIVVVFGGGGEREESEGAPGELVAAVAVKGLENPHKDPEEHRTVVHVLAQDESSNGAWESCTEDEFNRM